MSVVVRRYALTAAGLQEFRRDAASLGRSGFVPQSQAADGGHIHLGRLLLTGGWSVLAGKSGIRSEGTLTVTFVREAGPERRAPLQDGGWRPRGGYFNPST